jgi:hypothetical protein
LRRPKDHVANLAMVQAIVQAAKALERVGPGPQVAAMARDLAREMLPAGGAGLEQAPLAAALDVAQALVE